MYKRPKEYRVTATGVSASNTYVIIDAAFNDDNANLIGKPIEEFNTDLSSVTWDEVTTKPAIIDELVDTKTLSDSEATPILSVDVDNRILQSDDDTVALDWRLRILKDGAEQSSISWHTRLLQDSTGVQAADWDDRKLKDAAGAENMDWSDASIKMVALPVYANNAAALAGGLVAGQLYKTSATGDATVMITNAT